jgi:hypothetical protein
MTVRLNHSQWLVNFARKLTLLNCPRLLRFVS